MVSLGLPNMTHLSLFDAREPSPTEFVRDDMAHLGMHGAH